MLTIILTLAWTLNAFDCRCETGSVSESVKYADVVFSGQVVSRTLTSNYDSLGIVVTGDSSKVRFDWRNYPTAVVKIKGDKVYKGQMVSDTITILTPPTGGACGCYFKTDQKYIVYATIVDEFSITYPLKRRTFDNKTFWTHACMRTQGWNPAEENEILKVAK